MKVLTKSEEQIMQVIWKLERAFLKEIIEALPEPRPHNNTVATIIKILTEKEFVGLTVFGRMHQYYPLVSKDAYSKTTLKSMVKGYSSCVVAIPLSFDFRQSRIKLCHSGAD